jgi:hypothetical protein
MSLLFDAKLESLWDVYALDLFIILSGKLVIDFISIIDVFEIVVFRVTALLLLLPVLVHLSTKSLGILKYLFCSLNPININRIPPDCWRNDSFS